MNEPTGPPLRLGHLDAFPVAEECLRNADFREERVSRRLGVESLGHVDEPKFRSRVRGLKPGSDLLGVFSEVFVLGRAVSGETLQDLLTERQLIAFRNLDLLRLDKSNGSFYSPVRLIPIPSGADRDIFIASDRMDTPDGSKIRPFPDQVFSGHNLLTRRFLRMLPDRQLGSVLELCSGTAVASIQISRNAADVTAVDITPRSTHFAVFNCRLNGCESVDPLCGDLYQPVQGRRFDCIIAHPPYVPTLRPLAIFRDGGETGDSIVRAIIEGISEHLNPKGRFYLLTSAMDTAKALFEERARGWLGADAGQYDLIAGLVESEDPDSLGKSLAAAFPDTSAEDEQKWHQLFQDLEVERIIYCGLVGRKLPGGGGSVRRVPWENTGDTSGFDWLLEWLDWLRRPGRRELVLQSPPILADGVRLVVTHRMQHKSLLPEIFQLKNSGTPFPHELEIEAWVAGMVQWMDGTRTVGEILEQLKSVRAVAPEAPAGEFADFICRLAERGMLRFLGLDSPQT